MKTGTYVRRIDHRGRVALPPSFKNDSMRFVIVADGVLKVFELLKWKKFSDTAPNKKEVLANSYPVTLDRQNRILLPKQLRRSGPRDITFKGCGDYFELWYEKTVTDEQILAARKKGLTYVQLMKRFGISCRRVARTVPRTVRATAPNDCDVCPAVYSRKHGNVLDWWLAAESGWSVVAVQGEASVRCPNHGVVIHTQK